MLKYKEYRFCDRCFQELTTDDHIDLCCGEDARFYDLCEKCYEDYTTYIGERNDLDKQYDKLAEKYKFGKDLPKEGKDE